MAIRQQRFRRSIRFTDFLKRPWSLLKTCPALPQVPSTLEGLFPGISFTRGNGFPNKAALSGVTEAGKVPRKGTFLHVPGMANVFLPAPWRDSFCGNVLKNKQAQGTVLSLLWLHKGCFPYVNVQAKLIDESTDRLMFLCLPFSP